jgi:hypothetical protein
MTGEGRAAAEHKQHNIRTLLEKRQNKAKQAMYSYGSRDLKV